MRMENTAAFEAHAAQHRRNVREAMETARTVAVETFRGRGLITPRGAQLTVRLQTLEAIFEALIALSDTLESDAGCRGEVARPVRLIAAWLAAIGPEIEADQPLDTERSWPACSACGRAGTAARDVRGTPCHAGHDGTSRPC